ncbi:foldase protein PrsA [Paenibacillaceae bacterium GAS479]|nr:foldase protein PrsA [Paenibacillaceae bacterium GAS479]
MADKEKNPLDPNKDNHLTPEDTATREGADFAGTSGSERSEETMQAEELQEERRSEEAQHQAEHDAEVFTADPERAAGTLPLTPVVPVDDSSDVFEDDNSGNNNGPKRSSATIGWMVASLVLAVALIVALVSIFSSKGGETVATVNGEKITQNELYEMIAPTYGKSALDTLITMKLVAQEADNKGITVTKEEEDKELADVKKNFPSDAEFDAALAQSGMTLEDLKKQMLMQVQMRKMLADKLKVTDEDVKKYYDANKESFATPEQVKASHILVDTKEEADAIVKELNNGGDFAAIAKEKSKDTGSAVKGGDLGYFGKGQMVPEFDEAVFKMEIGKVSAPIKSEYGFHIIKLVDRKAAGTPTLEEKKAEIKTTLENEQLGTLSQTLVTDLRTKASISNKLDPTQDTKGGAENAAKENTPAENTATNTP